MRRLANALILVSLLCGCGPPSIDRAGAARLVEATEEFRAMSHALAPGLGTKQLGVALDLWDAEGRLTANGRRFLTRADAGVLVPVAGAPVVLEVTGIAPLPAGEDGSIVEVELLIRTTLELPLKALAASTGGGKAIARRFDDGWRLDQLELTWRPEQYDYHSALGVRGDIGSLPGQLLAPELEALRGQLSAVREARMARLRELDALIARSMVAAEREIVVAQPIRWSSYDVDRVEVTDVSVVVRNAAFIWGGDPADQIYPFRYFGSIPDLQPYDDQLQIYWRCGDDDWARDIRLNICLTVAYLPTADEANRLRQRVEARYAAWVAKYGAAPREREQLVNITEYVGE